MSQVTTHILDTALGKPAEGVRINLLRKEGSGWNQIARGTTNSDGRITDLLNNDHILPEGVFKMNFQTEDYHKRTGQPIFYPEVEIQFTIHDQSHYHIPLLLNPFGYSTYRGS